MKNKDDRAKPSALFRNEADLRSETARYWNKNCPNCGTRFEPEMIRCGTCNYVAETTKDEWKPANMGKQHGQRKANRTGKKGSFYERQNG